MRSGDQSISLSIYLSCLFIYACMHVCMYDDGHVRHTMPCRSAAVPTPSRVLSHSAPIPIPYPTHTDPIQNYQSHPIPSHPIPILTRIPLRSFRPPLHGVLYIRVCVYNSKVPNRNEWVCRDVWRLERRHPRSIPRPRPRRRPRSRRRSRS